MHTSSTHESCAKKNAEDDAHVRPSPLACLLLGWLAAVVGGGGLSLSRLASIASIASLASPRLAPSPPRVAPSSGGRRPCAAVGCEGEGEAGGEACRAAAPCCVRWRDRGAAAAAAGRHQCQRQRWRMHCLGQWLLGAARSAQNPPALRPAVHSDAREISVRRYRLALPLLHCRRACSHTHPHAHARVHCAHRNRCRAALLYST